jgi:hypothetical protein
VIETPITRIGVDSDPWTTANKRRLEQALADVRRALERYLELPSGPVVAASGPVVAASGPVVAAAVPVVTSDAARPFALDQVVNAFGLSPFERDVLVLCAGVELESGFGDLCARANGDPGRAHATFSIALAVLEHAHWSALAPSAALRRWRLIEPGSGPLTAAPLRIDERVLHHLVGVGAIDDRLAGYLEPSAPGVGPVGVVGSHEQLAHRIGVELAARPHGSPSPVIELCGPDWPSKRLVADVAAGHLGLGLATIRTESLPTDPRELEALIRLCEREAALAGVAICLDGDRLDATDAARDAAVTQLVDGLDAVLFLVLRDRRPARLRPVVTIDVQKPTSGEQLGAWRDLVGADRLDGSASVLVGQFDLGVRGIGEAAARALSELEGSVTGPQLLTALWDACRAQARPRMDDLAQRIESTAGWPDLVLPPGQLQALRELSIQVRHRARVYQDWGFARTGHRGLGIAALFVGTSGTGKTLAAEVLANELRLDLYRIDLSQVVSKYIGETEKNLRRVFDAAEGGAAILLFDEADALFGKRSEVRDSHDRYANIEVGYLLQRMEAYRGLAILTTNMKESIDPAFLRRIRFTVHFPFPDAVAREDIWRRVFPPAAPTRAVKPELLARLNVSGGSIRNIALNAAFLAAAADVPIGMDQLLRATRAEFGKLERTLTDSEVAGWA